MTAALPLVYITCGRGRRIAHLDELAEAGWRAHVWIDAAHRWTRTVIVRASRILGRVDVRDPHVRRAIASVAPGRPPCWHLSHEAELGQAAPR